jgi:next-to-BRCA1 protein 1
LAEFLCAPGRNTKHAALCDGCDKASVLIVDYEEIVANTVQPIFGVRHKCLNCPDWDYCSECVKNASLIHPGHRFAPLYEPIAAPRYRKARHVGIYCDGPLCESKQDYIEGTRYKCAICHDTDFCANCEAYPHNKHNHTHPLIQFKTSVRNATITTVHEDQYGRSLAPKGDRNAPKAESNKAPANAATQVQTIIDVKPAEVSTYKPMKEKIEIKDLLAEPIHEKIKVEDLLSSPIEEPAHPVDINKLNAVFVRETIPDGTVVNAESLFNQVWTLRNSGPNAWPAGCSVRYTGGDNMLMRETTTSNVIDRPVEVGEEIAFCVALKAPNNPGMKISYWRLKTGDGQAFGHRLWCHVTVALPIPQEPSSLPQVVSSPEQLNRQSSQWQDNFLEQALQLRLDRAQAIEKQRAELEKIKTRHEAKQVADAEAKANRAEMLRKLSSEIHAVETQHKARMAAAKAAIDAARVAKVASPQPQQQPATELPAPVSPLVHQMASVPSGMGGHMLQDYQMQLMLLEQQNKRRREQAVPPPRSNAQADLHNQLLRIEQQNKQRLMMMRAAEQQKVAPVSPPVPAGMGASVNQDREVAAEQKVAPVPPPAPVEVEAEVKPVTIEEVEDEETKPEAKSTMIFPKLDKESPVSSTHDVSSIKTETAPAPASPKSEKSEFEIFEDAESVSFIDNSDEEDGFLTDEEYDILDASDEDLAA